jgi:hypothetical protein
MDKQELKIKCNVCNKKLKVSDCDYGGKCLKCYTLAYHNQFYNVIFNNNKKNKLIK